MVTLWVSSTAPDVALLVHLEQVASDGVSTYVTEGALHALHRRCPRRPTTTSGCRTTADTPAT